MTGTLRPSSSGSASAGPWPARGCRTLSRDGGRDWIGDGRDTTGRRAGGRWFRMGGLWSRQIEKLTRKQKAGLRHCLTQIENCFQSILTPTLSKERRTRETYSSLPTSTKRLSAKPQSAVASARLPRQPRYERVGGRPHDITAGPVVSVVWAKKKGGEERGRRGQAKRGTTRMRRPAERILFCLQGVTEDGGTEDGACLARSPSRPGKTKRTPSRQSGGNPKTERVAPPPTWTPSPRSTCGNRGGGVLISIRFAQAVKPSPAQPRQPSTNQKPSRRNRSESAEPAPKCHGDFFVIGPHARPLRHPPSRARGAGQNTRTQHTHPQSIAFACVRLSRQRGRAPHQIMSNQ